MTTDKIEEIPDLMIGPHQEIKAAMLLEIDLQVPKILEIEETTIEVQEIEIFQIQETEIIRVETIQAALDLQLAHQAIEVIQEHLMTETVALVINRLEGVQIEEIIQDQTILGQPLEIEKIFKIEILEIPRINITIDPIASQKMVIDLEMIEQVLIDLIVDFQMTDRVEIEQIVTDLTM
jgi:hypothetical protein